MSTATATPARVKTISITDLPALHAELDGGSFIGLTTRPDGVHCAVTRLSISLPKSTWKKAMEAAKKEDAQLPSKAVAALLASNCELERGWYWTCDEYDASCACYFTSYGYTLLYDKSALGGAVALRLIPLTA